MLSVTYIIFEGKRCCDS